MNTEEDAYRLLLRVMGWQERIVAPVGAQQRGWVPPGEHDGTPILVELEEGAEMPASAVTMLDALQAVVRELVGHDDRMFVLVAGPATNSEGDEVVSVKLYLVPAEDARGLVHSDQIPTYWSRSLELGWAMNPGLMRETLMTWASQVTRDAPREPGPGVAEVERIHAGADELAAVARGIASILNEAQRVLDAGGKGSKRRALEILGLHIPA